MAMSQKIEGHVSTFASQPTASAGILSTRSTFPPPFPHQVPVLEGVSWDPCSGVLRYSGKQCGVQYYFPYLLHCLAFLTLPPSVQDAALADPSREAAVSTSGVPFSIVRVASHIRQSPGGQASITLLQGALPPSLGRSRVAHCPHPPITGGAGRPHTTPRGETCGRLWVGPGCGQRDSLYFALSA